MDLTRKKHVVKWETSQVGVLNCDTAVLIRFLERLGLAFRSRDVFLERLVSSRSWGFNVSVSSRSCDLTSCLHPCLFLSDLNVSNFWVVQTADLVLSIFTVAYVGCANPCISASAIWKARKAIRATLWPLLQWPVVIVTVWLISSPQLLRKLITKQCKMRDAGCGKARKPKVWGIRAPASRILHVPANYSSAASPPVKLSYRFSCFIRCHFRVLGFYTNQDNRISRTFTTLNNFFTLLYYHAFRNKTKQRNRSSSCSLWLRYAWS